MVWEFGFGKCKLLHLEWINKVLLYSTGNYIPSPGINHNAKEYKIQCIYTYMTESLFCTAENMISQLYFNFKRNSSCKVSKSQGCNTQHRDYSQYYYNNFV